MGAILHAYETGEMRKAFSVEIRKKTNTLENSHLDGTMILKWTLRKCNEWLWVESDWILMS